MKEIVSLFAPEDFKLFYGNNMHSALGDALTLARITLLPIFFEEFLVYCFKKESEKKRKVLSFSFVAG